jgi:hypothetical protein
MTTEKNLRRISAVFDYDAIRTVALKGDRASVVSDPDPVVAMWAERNRLDAAATEADRVHDNERSNELDDQRASIEEQIMNTPATSIAGLLGQVELLATVVPVAEDFGEWIGKAVEIIKAGLQGLQGAAVTGAARS